MVEKELLEKFASGKATAEELTQFWDWLHTISPGEYEALLEDYEGVWAIPDDYGPPDLAVLQKIRENKDAHERDLRKTRIRRLRPWVAAAACVLLIAGIAIYHFGPVKNTPQLAAVHMLTPGGPKAILTLGDGSRIPLDSKANGTIARQGATRVVKLSNGQLAYQTGANGEMPVYSNTLSVPRGGEYRLTLPDGSRVWLNAASSITYPSAFTGTTRNVQLDGEAYFEVTHDGDRPFTVSTGSTQVKVLGTEFNLMAYGDEGTVDATLVNGSIKVSKGIKSKVIRPGEQVSLPDGSRELNIVHPDMEKVLAWKDGEFSFEGTDIKVIMRQIARWYDVDVAYQGDVSQISLLGVISRKENANQLLEILEKTGKVHFSINGRTITVMPYSAPKK
jgi:transmembrane sensor